MKQLKKGKWLIFYLEETLDIKSSSEAIKTINKYIQAGSHDIIFNLKKVSIFSSNGIRVLVSTLRTLRNHNGELRLCELSDDIMEVFKIIDLEGLFFTFESESEALI